MSNQTQLSISAAATALGIERSTLYRHIKDKPISVIKNNGAHPKIEASELIRIYGDQFKIDALNGSKRNKNATKTNSDDTKNNTNTTISAENFPASEKIAVLEKERVREREQYESRIDHLENALLKAQDGQMAVTRILEDQSTKDSGAGEWEKSFKALENRIANQEAKEKGHQEREEKLLKQARHFKKALQEEKNKGFFQKLFG